MVRGFKALIGGLMVALCAAGAARADAVADFYKEKTLQFLVAYPAGGSYGLYARLVAPHFKKHLPGHPNIVIQHMPGAGGAKAANYFAHVAPRDGSMVAFLADALPVAQLLTPKRVKYDAAKFTWIGTIAPVNPVVMVRGGAKVKTIAELRRTSIFVACSGRGSQSFIMPAMLKVFAGFKWDLICGYKGSAAMTLALERGEVDAQSSAWLSWRVRSAKKIKAGELIPVVQIGLQREKELPRIPLMQDLVDDPKVKAMLRFVSSGAAVGRSIVAAPGTPADRVAALRAAFDETMKDPAFLADARKRHAVVDPAPGDEIQKVVAEVLSTPKDVVALAQQAGKLYKSNCTKNCTSPKRKKK